MLPYRYKKFLFRLKRKLDYENIKLIRETPWCYVYDYHFSHIYVPKSVDKDGHLFILFVRDNKVIDFYKTKYPTAFKAYVFFLKKMETHKKEQILSSC